MIIISSELTLCLSSYSESQSIEAPRLIIDNQLAVIGLTSNHHLSSSLLNQLYLEGELALLSCNVQAFSQAQISWFRRENAQSERSQLDMGGNVNILDSSEPLVSDRVKYAMLGNLLLINRVSRNDSGIYMCQVKNMIGEERLEMELRVRGKFA